MKIHDLPLHARPREKLLTKGADALADPELLAILLRSGYHGKSALEVAHRLLDRYSLRELLTMPVTKLSLHKGIGSSRALTLHAAWQLTQRAAVLTNEMSIVDSADVIKLLTHLRNKKQEYLVALYLNARHQLIEQRILTIGTLNSSLIHPREVFAPALEISAAMVILAHNHPSGESQPSLDDIETTEKLIEASEIMDIPLIDHLILSEKNWVSLRQLGYF